MTREPEQIIRRGADFTGRKLLEALKSVELAGQGGLGARAVTGGGADGRTYVEAPGPARNRRVRYYVRLGSSFPLGTNRWFYAWEEVIRVSSPFSNWITRPGGRNNDNRSIAFNFAEHGNNGAGIEGNGVNVDELPAGFFIAPAPSGRIIELTEITLSDGQRTDYWFDFNNAVQGECQL